MAFVNSSVFFIPITFDNYDKFVGAYSSDAQWSDLPQEEYTTQYLLRYVKNLAQSKNKTRFFRYNDPKSLPVYMYENDESFDTVPDVSQVRLTCFATGIAFFEIWVDYGDMPIDDIMNFAYKFKKTCPSAGNIPQGKKCLCDIGCSLLPKGVDAELFFANDIEFKRECLALHMIYLPDEKENAELDRKLELLKHSYSSTFSGYLSDDGMYDMTYKPYSYDMWAGSQEGLVNIVMNGANDTSDYYIREFKYKHLTIDYRFLYLMLLNQRFASIKYIQHISEGNNLTSKALDELRKNIIRLKTEFSFKVVSNDPIFQNVYSKMYNVLEIDNLLVDIRENEEQVAFYHGMSSAKRERTTGKLLAGLSLLSLFSALIDASSYFDRFPKITAISTILSLVCVSAIVVLCIVMCFKERG